MDEKKILIIINALETGGAENQVANILRLLGEQFEFHVITLLRNDPLFIRNNINTERVTIHSLNSGKSMLNFPRVFFKMLSLTKKIKPDLIHGVLFQSNILSRLLKMFTGIKTVNSVYDISEEPSFNIFLLRWTNRYADRIFFDNTVGKNNYVEKRIMRPEQVAYIPNGLGSPEKNIFDETLANELLHRVNFKEGENLWLNVSRFAIQKDHKTLITAFELLLREFPENKLLLIGDGYLVEDIKSFIETKGLGEKIFYLGRINDIYTLCRLCGQYVCASAWEGMPIIIMQAMMYRLPVVSTNVGAIPDLIENNITGYLCPRRDPAALCAAMKQMLAAGGPGKESIKEKAFKKVTEEFSPEKLRENWYNNYIAEINRR